MDNLTTIQSVKQETRKFMAVATDKMALASASVSRGETHVSSDSLDAREISHTSRIPGGTVFVRSEYGLRLFANLCHPMTASVDVFLVEPTDVSSVCIFVASLIKVYGMTTSANIVSLPWPIHECDYVLKQGDARNNIFLTIPRAPRETIAF